MDRDTVLSSLTRARNRLLAAIYGLAQEDMTTHLVCGEWTIREVLAHIAGWAAWDFGAIKDIKEGTLADLSVILDVDPFNQGLVAERSGRSTEQILDELSELQDATQQLLGEMPKGDILTSDRYRGPFWNSLAEWLQVAWEHEEEHAAQIESWRDRRGAAEKQG